MEVAMASKHEVYEDKAGGWRWRLKAANGEIVAQGESYTSRSNAREGCEAVQRAAAGAGATIIDVG
jgi:uncharacterized protein YegP (UPF0339 family)